MVDYSQRRGDITRVEVPRSLSGSGMSTRAIAATAPARRQKPIYQVEFTVGEEIANSITHGIGALLAIAGVSVMIPLGVLRGDVWHVVSFSVYGFTLITLYTASTLYHSITNLRAKHILQILDHSSIFLLIAGTYTPFTLVALRGPWGWSLFGVVWGLAAFGVFFKSLFIKRYRRVSVVLYVIMGWLSAIAFHEMIAVLPRGTFICLVLGGVFYTGGIAFYGWKKLPYNHAIWHFFVMAGSACHYFGILLML